MKRFEYAAKSRWCCRDSMPNGIVRRDRHRAGSRPLVLPRRRHGGALAKAISAYDTTGMSEPSIFHGERRKCVCTAILSRLLFLKDSFFFLWPSSECAGKWLCVTGIAPPKTRARIARRIVLFIGIKLPRNMAPALRHSDIVMILGGRSRQARLNG